MSRTTTADPSLIPDIDAFEERAAIAEYEAGLTRKQAEDLAAQAQGFRSHAYCRAWFRVHVDRKRLGWGPNQS